MTAAIVAMLYFRGNFRMACQFLCEYDYMPHMLSRSRFNRRLHRISEFQRINQNGGLNVLWKSCAAYGGMSYCNFLSISNSSILQAEATSILAL
jgi:hypothetical protein